MTKILIIKVRAWKKEVILPQRMDFVLPFLATKLSLNYLDIQPIRRLGYYAGYFFSFFLAIPSVLFRKYDYLLLENPYLVIFSPLAKLRRKKVIAEYVDFYPANLIRLQKQKNFRYQVAKVVCRIFSHFVDKITTESQTSKDTLIQWGVPVSKITIIPVGINTEKMKFTQTKNDIIHFKFVKDKKRIIFGYLGKMVDYYNLQNILKAIAKIQSDNLSIYTLFVGDGPEKINLEKLAIQLNLSCVFTGSVPHSEVAAYYSLMDAFIFPLNALAIKIGEILSIGLPIIVPKGMAEDWIVDSQTGIVARNNSAEEIAIAIKNFLSLSSDEVSSMKLNQQLFAKKILDVKIVAKKYIELLM